ncbi:protease [Pedobacter sp. PWIIR3]
MNKIKFLLAASIVFAFAACSQSSRSTETTANHSDSTAIHSDTVLTGKLSANPTQKIGTPLELTFTVYNHTDSARKFCKWHTPFEPLMIKYLDIVAESGEEAAYKGPMAKRIMPPPADSYISIAPGDSLSVKTDLLKAYTFNSPGKYKILYNSSAISGVNITDSISVNLEK